jgi:hypothetical protein
MDLENFFLLSSWNFEPFHQHLSMVMDAKIFNKILVNSILFLQEKYSETEFNSILKRIIHYVQGWFIPGIQVCFKLLF